MDFWQVFPVAVALVFIIEGFLPFLVPAQWRAMLAKIILLDETTIRRFGLVSMLLGLGLLYLVN